MDVETLGAYQMSAPLLGVNTIKTESTTESTIVAPKLLRYGSVRELFVRECVTYYRLVRFLGFWEVETAKEDLTVFLGPDPDPELCGSMVGG